MARWRATWQRAAQARNRPTLLIGRDQQRQSAAAALDRLERRDLDGQRLDGFAARVARGNEHASQVGALEQRTQLHWIGVAGDHVPADAIDSGPKQRPRTLVGP